MMVWFCWLGVALQAGAVPVVWEPKNKASRTPSKEQT